MDIYFPSSIATGQDGQKFPTSSSRNFASRDSKEKINTRSQPTSFTSPLSNEGIIPTSQPNYEGKNPKFKDSSETSSTHKTKDFRHSNDRSSKGQKNFSSNEKGTRDPNTNLPKNDVEVQREIEENYKHKANPGPRAHQKEAFKAKFGGVLENNLQNSGENVTRNDAEETKTGNISEIPPQSLKQKNSEGLNAHKKGPFPKNKFQKGGAVENSPSRY